MVSLVRLMLFTTTVEILTVRTGTVQSCHQTPIFPYRGRARQTKYEVVEPTGHELESRSSVEGWEAIRIGLRNVVTESAAMPLEQKCFMCCDQASLRCPQCGPLGFYCCDCFKKAHCHVNVFHVAEKWEV